MPPIDPDWPSCSDLNLQLEVWSVFQIMLKEWRINKNKSSIWLEILSSRLFHEKISLFLKTETKTIQYFFKEIEIIITITIFFPKQEFHFNSGNGNYLVFLLSKCNDFSVWSGWGVVHKGLVLPKTRTVRVHVPYPHCAGAARTKNHLCGRTRTSWDTNILTNF